MSNIVSSAQGGEPLLTRLRRMGWILTGEQQVADSVLQTAFERSRTVLAGLGDQLTELDLFKLGFDAFDDAAHQKGVVVILKQPLRRGGTLGDDIKGLTYVERIAVALMLVEGMPARMAAILSGRPQRILEESLTAAVAKLEPGEIEND